MYFLHSGSPANGSNGRSSDDGSGNSSTSSAHRYKFKSNIKQRFTADCQTIDDRSRFTSTSGGGKCGGPHEAVEADREIDISSDTEEIREDTPGPEDAMKVSHHGNQSAGEETESKPLPQSPMNQRRLSGGAICTGGPQISVIGTAPEDRNVFSSAAPNSPTMDINKSCGTSVALDMDNSTSHDVNEVKPCPEDLAAAMQNLNGPSKHKIPLPIFITGEEATPGKGIPAFALHEKGRFYIPVTLDKSLAGPYMNKFDTCVAAAPPLYPVTISVCFVVGTDKKGKCETTTDAEVSTVEGEKAADFSPPTNNHVPLPLVTSSGSNLLKPNRRTYRENHYVSSRFGHQRSAPSSKDSNMGNSRSKLNCFSYSFRLFYKKRDSYFSLILINCFQLVLLKLHLRRFMHHIKMVILQQAAQLRRVTTSDEQVVRKVKLTLEVPDAAELEGLAPAAVGPLVVPREVEKGLFPVLHPCQVLERARVTIHGLKRALQILTSTTLSTQILTISRRFLYTAI